MCLITVVICHMLQWVRDSDCAHWVQMLPSSSSFHLQSIQEKFMAPLCCSELQEKAAVLTWQRPQEQQEQKCCPAAPWGEVLPGGQGCAWHGQSRSHSCLQHSSCCGRKEGMEHCGCQGSIPASPGTSSPSHGWAVLSVALDCTGLSFKTPHKSFSKEGS